MTNWAALDVAIGVVVVYFLLSLIASTLNETIATALGWRSRFLETWLRNVLVDPTARLVWWCYPRFDSDPIFCRLIAGDEEKGFSDVVLDGMVDLSPRGLSRQADDEITTRLSTVRGIGPWTADMFLMFQLRRLDVWPTGDFGVRRGYGLAWNVPMPGARALQPLGEPYRPYRSIAAWYCWRAVELYAGSADSALTR